MLRPTGYLTSPHLAQEAISLDFKNFEVQSPSTKDILLISE